MFRILESFHWNPEGFQLFRNFEKKIVVFSWSSEFWCVFRVSRFPKLTPNFNCSEILVKKISVSFHGFQNFGAFSECPCSQNLNKILMVLKLSWKKISARFQDFQCYFKISLRSQGVQLFGVFSGWTYDGFFYLVKKFAGLL